MRERGKVFAGGLLLMVAACRTEDVTPLPAESELYDLPDPAFGEYLVYLGIPGAMPAEDDPTAYQIDTALVDGVADLSLSKTSSSVEDLVAAGLTTAEQKITDVDGLQFFTNLRTLSLTANDVQQIDLTQNTALVEIGLNFNLIGELDLTQNGDLVELRYRGSAQADEDQLLSDIDLSGNPELRHLFLPNHDLVAIDLTNNPNLDELIDLSGNPGPDGDPDTADIIIPAAIYDQIPPESRLGVISDAGVVTEVQLTADATAVDEAGGTTTLTASLNRVAEDEVTVTLQTSGSATLDADYSLTSTTISIPAGSLSASVTLTGIDDDTIEGGETAIVSIAQTTGAEQGAQTSVSIRIEDDELSVGLTLNEILYDPSNEGLDGDANGDGTYVQDEDEFIELVNTSGSTLDLSGWSVYDTEAFENDTPRHVFAPGTTLADGGVLVLFGGGTPTGSFGGATVVTTTTGALNLNNSGDELIIENADGQAVLGFDVEPLSNNPNESYTRQPDLTGSFEQHSESNATLFSPGTRADGTPF